ncbi:hypothetical protein IV203_006395 [Nitzschia inconspicua]|uniref:Uncharacterized protein n=1 Tax=Nitzschia inconspicua TaxID=303405 RepID=A0A9K3KA76_9STRA|nr:hypothetical protein IV203_006580 [Nitzschia inconspicua]KAG7339992.1 hypothetical protein IV203_006395 [Nitzschia inconspicua]
MKSIVQFPILFLLSMTMMAQGGDAFASPAVSFKKKRPSKGSLLSTRSPLDFDISALYSDDPEDEHDTVASAYTDLSGLWSDSSSRDSSFIPRSSDYVSSYYASIATYDDDDDADSTIDADASTITIKESMFLAPSNRSSHKGMKDAMLLMEMFYSTGIRVENDSPYFQ